MTASKDFTEPVCITCDALDMSWDELTDQGFRLGKVTLRADGEEGNNSDV
jgi:hypothetical protein